MVVLVVGGAHVGLVVGGAHVGLVVRGAHAGLVIGGARVDNQPVGSGLEARTMEVTATMTKDLAKLIKEYWNNGVVKYDTITHDSKIYKNCFFSKDCTATIGSDTTLMFTILDYNA